MEALGNPEKRLVNPGLWQCCRVYRLQKNGRAQHGGSPNAKRKISELSIPRGHWPGRYAFGFKGIHIDNLHEHWSNLNLGSTRFAPPPPKSSVQGAVPYEDSQASHTRTTQSIYATPNNKCCSAMLRARHPRAPHKLHHPQCQALAKPSHAMPNAYQTALRDARQCPLPSCCNPDLQQHIRHT